MSRAVSKGVQAVGSVFTGDAFGGGGGSAPAAKPAPAAREPELQAKQAVLDNNASAASVTRSDSDADLLGYTSASGTKKRSASQALLG